MLAASTISLVLALLLGAQEAVVPGERASEMKREYPFVRFSLLAGFQVPELDNDVFGLSPHAAAAREGDVLSIPNEVHALNGQKVSVRGFMLPVDVEGGRVTRFILTASIDSCHFGMIGQANEWILVTMGPGRYAPFPKFTPITVLGRLDVRPEMRGDRLAGLYHMTADAIAVH